MTSTHPSHAPSLTASKLTDAADALAADVFYVSSPLYAKTLDDLRSAQTAAYGHDRCVLALTTPGGDAHSAYRMARLLRKAYRTVVVCVFGYCKSAGTLLALGGHEIVLGDRGELGPLDVQIRRDDELGRYGSGLEIFISLDLLRQHAFRGFEQYFVDLISKSGGSITIRTAAEMATNLTVGLMQPICAQIDPHRLGLERRALEIAVDYATRLQVSPDAIARLTESYPDHSFVIDREEAGEFLQNVRSPSDVERELEQVLSQEPGLYSPGKKPIVACLNPKTGQSPHVDPSTADDPTTA